MSSSDAALAQASSGSLTLDLRAHEVCWVLPQGATMVGSIDCPGGALILGRFEGKILCRLGSLIIGASGEFAGKAEARQIYVEGLVRNTRAQETTVLNGMLLIAVAESARCRANLFSRAFALHTKNFSGQLTTIAS